MNESKLRKNKSIKILQKKNIPYTNWLPTIGGIQHSLRCNTKEVAYRAMVLQTVALKAEGLPQNIVDVIINDYGLENHFTAEERNFIYNKNVDDITNIQFLWRYEAYWVLLWSLGFLKTLDYPDSTCDVALAISMLKDRSKESFLQDARLRSQEEILDQADLIYRDHWAVRDKELYGFEPPANLNAGVVFERHYALNWLIGHSNKEWDNISTDT
jgi:hypothetical protein